MIALMFNYLDRQLMTLLITPIKADFGLSDTQISLLNGLGPLVVGLFNDNVFGESGIASSMVVLALIAGPLGLLFAWLSLKPYAREMAAAEERGD